MRHARWDDSDLSSRRFEGSRANCIGRAALLNDEHIRYVHTYFITDRIARAPLTSSASVSRWSGRQEAAVGQIQVLMTFTESLRCRQKRSDLKSGSIDGYLQPPWTELASYQTQFAKQDRDSNTKDEESQVLHETEVR